MTLEGMAEDTGIDETPILRAGTTAMAAFYVNGRTLHSIFRIPSSTSNQYTALDAGNAQSLQADLQDVRYLIVDEGAMLGSALEFRMDQRCRDMFWCFQFNNSSPLAALPLIRLQLPVRLRSWL
ncbi:hypothetical protein V8E54_004586 [Elaphomyces granulatus]|jgi:hypothetical protein